MLGGRGGLNPRQMKRLMKEMKQEELDATEVIIKLADKEIVISNPEVTRIKMGQVVYQISGSETTRPLGAATPAESKQTPVEIKEQDVKVLMEKTGASKEKAVKALKDNEGDLVRALLSLRKGK